MGTERENWLRSLAEFSDKLQKKLEESREQRRVKEPEIPEELKNLQFCDKCKNDTEGLTYYTLEGTRLCSKCWEEYSGKKVTIIPDLEDMEGQI